MSHSMTVHGRTSLAVVKARAFSLWSEKTHGWTIPEGAFSIFARDSSAETPLATTITLVD